MFPQTGNADAISHLNSSRHKLSSDSHASLAVNGWFSPDGKQQAGDIDMGTSLFSGCHVSRFTGDDLFQRSSKDDDSSFH